MLGQFVVSAPFMLATAKTGESPDLAGKKAQTLQMAKEGDTACFSDYVEFESNVERGWFMA